eukprot:467787-Amphidinium_carterae.1
MVTRMSLPKPYLYLHHTSLFCALPEDGLSRMTVLSSLWLGFNSFYGTLPDSGFEHLQSLQGFEI